MVLEKPSFTVEYSVFFTSMLDIVWTNKRPKSMFCRDDRMRSVA